LFRPYRALLTPRAIPRAPQKTLHLGYPSDGALLPGLLCCRPFRPPMVPPSSRSLRAARLCKKLRGGTGKDAYKEQVKATALRKRVCHGCGVASEIRIKENAPALQTAHDSARTQQLADFVEQGLLRKRFGQEGYAGDQDALMGNDVLGIAGNIQDLHPRPARTDLFRQLPP